MSAFSILVGGGAAGQLGFTLPLVLFAAFSMLMMYLNRLQSGFYKAHRVWLVTAYKLGRAALHASPNMALWWEHRSLSWLPLVGLWNLIFGSKASLLMFQSFGGQVLPGPAPERPLPPDVIIIRGLPWAACRPVHQIRTYKAARMCQHTH